MLDHVRPARHGSCRGSTAGARRRVRAVASWPVNQVKTRLQSLGLLDRSFQSTTDEELTAAVDGLADDHRDALQQLVGGDTLDADGIREAATRGRIDGTMESIALVITDACLADCIKELGDHADHPSSAQLREVLPGVVERHGVAITRMMLASTVVGEAPAAAIIRDLLKNDELVKLPPAEPKPMPPMREAARIDAAEREALKAKRKEAKAKKQAAARAAREQSARDRGRV
jgi:hypothetical protein